MTKKIIILEGINDVNKILKKELENEIIISFDFEAHKKLKEEKIKHVLVEDYFSDTDKKLLGQKTMEFALTWYKELDKEKKLFVNGICLGELLEMEILNYFCKILKRVIGITNVIQEEKPEKIIGFSLYPFLKNICKEKNIELDEYDTEIESSLYYDTIELPIRISKNKRIKISREKFLKIKNIVENITSILANSKLKNFYEDYGLLLDFNLMQYDEMISEISKKHKIVLLNQRRPVIWNLRSFNITKKMNLKILKLEQMSDEKLNQKIKLEKNRIEKDLESIFSKSRLDNYFVVKENSFWTSINENLHIIINKRFQEFVEKIYLTINLFETLKIRYILEWAHNAPEEQIMVRIAKTKNIPVIFLQHAMLPLNKKWDIYHPIYPYFPTDNTIEATWGNIMKDYLKNNNINDEKILESGSPKHDIYFKKKITKSNGNILITTNHFAHFNYEGTDSYAYEKLEEFVKKIFKSIKEKTDRKIIVKFHPGKGFYNIKTLITSIDPNVTMYEDVDLPNLIASCDEMISLNFSTVILEAMMLKKPTMTILAEKQCFEDENVIKNGATLMVSKLEEFESKFEDLFNSEIREKLIHEGTRFIDNYFSNQGTASQKIANELNRIIRK